MRKKYFLPSLSFQHYKLKSSWGHIHYGFTHSKQAYAHGETCEELVHECKEKFGEDYKYIQAGTMLSNNWYTVISEEDDTICQHLYADDI